ncbi:MAG: glutathione peroxidase [Fermentimonas sp.]|nr:glutathione peroxidase [Fermentimonas sp.]
MNQIIKYPLTILLILISFQCNGQTNNKEENKNNMQEIQTLHDFVVKDINGKDFDLATLKGNKVLVVNVASKCGLTPQYEDLQALYDKYKNKGFVVIGFPANNFMNQEPGTNSEIMEFCTANYGVSFPMMDKISVKGKNQSPLYKWLTNKSENGKLDQDVTWNFQKFMIDENGHLVDVVMPKKSPMSDKIINWLNN